jgi:NMD protein affecting ribosome stability and mRNA decay
MGSHFTFHKQEDRVRMELSPIVCKKCNRGADMTIDGLCEDCDRIEQRKYKRK